MYGSCKNNQIIIPNSVIRSDVIVNANMSDTKCCKMIEIGICYTSKMERALKIMTDEVAKHPLHIDTRTPDDINNGVPSVIARVIGLGDSSVTLKIWAWAANPSDGFVLYCDLLQSIKHRFDAENIEVPFPQRVVTLNKKDD